MIESVISQTYVNWELCLVDGSYNQLEIRKDFLDLTIKDPRIKYKLLRKNVGDIKNIGIIMSTGDYLGVLNQNDLLHPSMLYYLMCVICDHSADFVYTDEISFTVTPDDASCPQFKPDFALDNLRAQNYICNFFIFSRELAKKVGMFRDEFGESQDYDMVLRLAENAERIIHIPEILYYRRVQDHLERPDTGANDAAKRAIAEHLERVGLEGTVRDSISPSIYKIHYKIHGNPLISIIIPNKDHIGDLSQCVNSIIKKSSYRNFEIIIVENNSVDLATFEFYEQLQETYAPIKVVTWSGSFNYSAINNFGFQYARGAHILLLNNDIEVISPDWLQEMLMFSQRPDVGAVGAKLYYPDDTIQHAGIILGLLTLAGHSHRHSHREDNGYMGRLKFAQNLSAVTAACMMIPRHVFEQMRGLDESFKVAFNDVDLCMRIRKANYLIVFTPYAELYHYESKSRGVEDTLEKQKRFLGEVRHFQKKWKYELAAGDPYYNPNLTLDREDFSLK